jgi:arylsulfatase A-like enzyme
MRAKLERAYDAEIAFLDFHLGTALAQLQSLPRLRNAVIVLTSDHGEELAERYEPAAQRAAGRYFEHRGYGHGHTMHEELLHVPLLIRFPDRLHAGQRHSPAVQHTDLLPTLAAIAGIPADVAVNGQGRDLSAAIEESSATESLRVLFAEYSLYGPELKQARVGELKLILRTDDGSSEAFDLESDPGELRGSPQESFAGGNELNDELTRWMETLPANPGTSDAAPGQAADAGLRRRLEALGYLDH